MEVKTIEINVSQLLKAPIGLTRAYEVSALTDILDSGDKSLIQGSVKLTRTDWSILVTSRLQTDAEVVCCRCLMSFRLPLTFDIEEEFFPTTDVVSGLPVDKPAEPGSFTIDEHHILDLSEAIRQYALTAIPIKTLCRPDCAGLCPTCGKNLNQGRCSCPQKEIDPRWAKLEEIAWASGVREDEGKGED